MKTYEVWMEGYAGTGDSGQAHLLGSAVADTFFDAYLQVALEVFKEDQKLVRKYEPVIWGCRCYDNEVDARKRFG